MLRALSRCYLWPLNQDVRLNLRVLDFQSEPADEIIADTRLTFDAPLITCNVRIRTSELNRLLP